MNLGGGFNDFLFSPRTLGFHDPVWLAHIFADGLVKNHHLVNHTIPMNGMGIRETIHLRSLRLWHWMKRWRRRWPVLSSSAPWSDFPPGFWSAHLSYRLLGGILLSEVQCVERDCFLEYWVWNLCVQPIKNHERFKLREASALYVLLYVLCTQRHLTTSYDIFTYSCRHSLT